MHPDDIVPLLLRHVENHAVAQNPGDIDQNIELAEFLDGLIDEALAAFHGRDVHVVGGRFPARGLDLLDHLVGRRLGFLLTRDGNTEIVDDHGRAVRRQQFGYSATDTASAAGDCGYFSIEHAHG